MKVKLGFTPEGPTPNPSWQMKLNEIAPKEAGLSYLKLYWEPGYPWEPVYRWMIAQITPNEYVPDFYREYLEGPNPASMGYFQGGKWVSTAPPISRRQWRFYRDTGCLFQPYWCIQGKNGGHKLRFNRYERTLIRSKGGDPHPPVPGDLPYAAPDNRTWAMLARRDRLRAHCMALDFVEGSQERLDHEERAIMRAMREEVYDWVSKQMGEAADMAASYTNSVHWENAPRTEPVDAKLEEFEEAYITGELE